MLSSTMRRVRISSARMLLRFVLVDCSVSAMRRDALVLRDRQGVQDFLDDILRRDVLGLCLISHRHTMPQYIHRNRLDVLGCYEVPAVEKGHGACSQRQRDGGPGRRAV